MRYYDVLFIVKANLGEEKYTEIVKKFESWVSQNDGRILSVTPQGQRQLPVTFKNHSQGYFIEAQFGGTNATLAEVTRQFQLNESIIRHLILRLEEILPKDKIDALVSK